LIVLRCAVAWLLALLMCQLSAQAAPFEPRAGAPVDLMEGGQLFAAEPAQALPADRAALGAWLQARKPAPKVNIFGGAYWLHAQVRHADAGTAWTLDPNNTIVDRIDGAVFGSDGSVQRFTSGYRAAHTYAMHYGVPLQLAPGVVYDVVLRFESPYYASVPRFEVADAAGYQRKVTLENAAVLAALGAMAALGVFYLFLYLLARTRAHLFYAGQMITGCWGWAMTFQLPAELFGWHDLRWHYIPFFLVPAVGSWFSIEFLELKRHQRGTAHVFRAIAWTSLALSPMSWFAVSYAHGTATLLISAWMSTALYAGVRALLRGYRPARFFVLAFVALLLPACIILPGNLDLIPDLVENAELWTLVGAMTEGLLQAFALADRIRIMTLEKDSYLQQLGQALEVAHTDVLTGIGNRFAFGRVLEEATEARRRQQLSPKLLLAIDLDGLKRVNDCHGHQRGDELIKTVAKGLIALTGPSGACFRLGGDEFAVLAPAQEEARLRAGLAALDAELRAMGFADSGISYGVAHWVDDADPLQLMALADRQMYEHKVGRKRERGNGESTMAAAL
jgi:diguanylate cyclase (GGDEF)-like protein